MLLSPKRCKSEARKERVCRQRAGLEGRGEKEGSARARGRTEEQSKKAKLEQALADPSGSKEENGRRKAAVRSGRSDGCLGSGVGCGG